MPTVTPNYPHISRLKPNDCANLDALKREECLDLTNACEVLRAHNLHGAPAPNWTPEFRLKVAKYAQAVLSRKVRAEPMPLPASPSPTT